jgi:hypothetical protein
MKLKKNKSLTNMNFKLYQELNIVDKNKPAKQRKQKGDRVVKQNSKSMPRFDTKLPNIPLEAVMENRQKIRTLILDIKTNIYKI